MDATGSHSESAFHETGQTSPPNHGTSGRYEGPTFDPEFYETAVGNDQDMDDIISRMMDAQIARGGGGIAPASAAAIASLKKTKLYESMLDANGKADCTVCTDDVDVGEIVTELPCKHWFHEACINHWLSTHGNCPHCREKISPDDEASPEKGSNPARGPKVERSSEPEGKRGPQAHDSFDEYRDELLARSIYMAQRPSLHDDEAFARSLQEEHTSSIHDDEVFARRLYKESRPSDEADTLARRLYEESQPSLQDDEALARRLYEESRLSVPDDADMARRMHEESEALARRLQEENELVVHADEALARRLQDEAERECYASPYRQGPYRRPASNSGSPAGEGTFGRLDREGGSGSPPGSFSPTDRSDGYSRLDHGSGQSPSNREGRYGSPHGGY